MGFERDEVPSQGAGAAPLPGRDSAQIPFRAIFAAGKRARASSRNPKMGFERDEVPSQSAGAAPLPGRGSAQIPFHAIFAAGKRARVYTKEPQNGFRKGRSPFAGCRSGASAGSGQRPDATRAIFAAGKRARASSREPLHKHPLFPSRKALLPSAFCLQTFPDILAPRCCRLSFLVVCFQKCILYILKMHFSF